MFSAAFIISTGKWGGVYWYKGFGIRICLGWIAFTFLPMDGDDILDAAAKQWDKQTDSTTS